MTNCVKIKRAMPGIYPEDCFFVSYKLIKEVGINSAIVYAYMQIIAPKNDWFACPVAELMKELNLGEVAVTSATKKLVQAGYIEKQLKGIPAKRCFRIIKEVV